MKKFMIIIVILLALIGGSYFFITNNKKEEVVDFDYFSFSIYGTMSGHEQYEVKKLDDGLLFEYSYVDYRWDNVANESVEKKNIIRSVKKDLNTYQEICELLKENKVSNWDGFSKTNPDVLDGGGFSFKLVFNDETKVSANGTNSYPKNYGEVLSTIKNHLLLDQVKDTSFETPKYSCQLPEKWVGTMNIRYSDEYVEFYSSFEEQELALLFIRDVSYIYSNDSKYYLVGTLEKQDEDDLYLFVNTNDYNYLYDKLDNKQKAIIDSLEEDKIAIINSFVGLNDYTLVKAE